MNTDNSRSGASSEEPGMLSWALWYARLGWAVLPLWWWTPTGCACGRSACRRVAAHAIGPCVPNGVKDASRDEQTLLGWWTRYPSAGIGVVTGPASGVAVLEVDPERGGYASLAALSGGTVSLPETVEARAAGGIRSYWFVCPDGGYLSRTAMGAGLGIRGDDDLVVVAPSLDATGRPYAWESRRGPDVARPAVLPSWLGPVAPAAGDRSSSVPKSPGESDNLGELLAPLDDLPVNPEVADVERLLRRIGPGVSTSDDLRRRSAIAAVTAKLKDLGVPTPSALAKAAFDRDVAEVVESPGSGKAPVLREDLPWASPVDGAALLAELAAVYRRFLILPPHGAELLALWTVFTYTLHLAETNPRLWIHSPMKECGKSRLLHVLEALCNRPLMASNITPAALFRCIDAFGPTLLLDEFDNAQADERAELRAILNSGHTRGGAFTMKVVGDAHEPRMFSTWAAIVFAGISTSTVPDTVASRSIRLEMRRRLPGETIERFSLLELPAAVEPIRSRIVRWVEDNETPIRESDPKAPLALGDRQADNWRPLLRIAAVAGGSWQQLAVEAAVEISGAQRDTDAGLQAQLLGDIRDLFDETGVDKLSSLNIITNLNLKEDRPWAGWRGGKGLTASLLAKFLKEFGISPRTIRTSAHDTPKGYQRTEFEDAFARYLTVKEPADPNAVSGSPPLLDPPFRPPAAPGASQSFPLPLPVEALSDGRAKAHVPIPFLDYPPPPSDSGVPLPLADGLGDDGGIMGTRR